MLAFMKVTVHDRVGFKAKEPNCQRTCSRSRSSHTVTDGSCVEFRHMNDSWQMTNSSTGRHGGDDPLLSNLIEQGCSLHSQFVSVYW